MKQLRTISLFLSIALLTASYSTTKTDDLWDLLTWLVGYSQHQEAQEQKKQQQQQNERQRSNNQFNTTNTRLTIDDYLNQLKYDLAGINQQSWNSIENRSRQNLQYVNLQHPETVNSKIRSVLIDVTGEESDKFIDNLKNQGWQIDSRTKRTIRNSMEGNILARISQTHHLSGENLYQFYGEELKKTILDILKSPEYTKQSSNNNSYYNVPQKPTPSAPPVDHGHTQTQYPSSYNNTRQETPTNASNTPHKQECAKKNKAAMKNMLSGSGLAQNDITHLENLVFDSTLHLSNNNSDDFIAHAKNSFAQFLDEQLTNQEEALKRQVKDLKKLHESIETTRSVILAELANLKTLDKTAVKRLFTASNLESTILENMGDISCSVCCEFFIQDHHEGCVNKKQLPCKHFTCETCIKSLNRKCPICRAAF